MDSTGERQIEFPPQKSEMFGSAHDSQHDEYFFVLHKETLLRMLQMKNAESNATSPIRLSPAQVFRSLSVPIQLILNHLQPGPLPALIFQHVRNSSGAGLAPVALQRALWWKIDWSNNFGLQGESGLPRPRSGPNQLTTANATLGTDMTYSKE